MGAVALLLFSLFAQDPVRTADIAVRGLKAADFPRVTRLAAAPAAGRCTSAMNSSLTIIVSRASRCP